MFVAFQTEKETREADRLARKFEHEKEEGAPFAAEEKERRSLCNCPVVDRLYILSIQVG